MGFKTDIFLMYCGRDAQDREYRTWSREEVEKILVYKTNETWEPFFQSILLLGIRSGTGGSLVPGFKSPGSRTDWLAWLNDIFLQGSNVDAIKKTVRSFNLPPVDLWVSLPYPDPSQNNFGSVWGKEVNFKNNSERLATLKWWIRRFLNRWEASQAQPTALRLKGFYWPRESMTLADRLLIPPLLSYIRSLGLKSLWIPYFAVTQFLKLQNPGFDVTIIQPSYFQNPQIGWERLSKAYDRAKRTHAGIEIEFDTSVIYPDSAGFKIALDYLNRGLPEYDGYMNNTVKAYYTGYKTLIELYNHQNRLYHYVFKFIKGTYKKINYPEIKY